MEKESCPAVFAVALVFFFLKKRENVKQKGACPVLACASLARGLVTQVRDRAALPNPGGFQNTALPLRKCVQTSPY